MSHESSEPTLPAEAAAIAALLDHAILQPVNTLEDTLAACELGLRYGVACVCVKPAFIRETAEALAGSKVVPCSVTSFPAGNSSIRVKAFEIEDAIANGATEIDTVINTGLVRGKNWSKVSEELAAMRQAAPKGDVLLKIIYETDFLTLDEIKRITELCVEAGVDYVKTSTGFGYVKQASGEFNYKGATLEHVAAMAAIAKGHCGVKASGGIRSLDDVIAFRNLGCTRIGVGGTAAIMTQALERWGDGKQIKSAGDGSNSVAY